ncbi:MAG: NUDIX domain-containing protein [Paraprevotella sp.]|nr:NUDIX domain-containing protein [Paraprevotella sp.]
MTHEHPFAQFHYCPKCGSPRFVVHNEKSKQCEDCGFVYYFNPSAATVAVILNERRELLVCRRGKEPAKGTLDLPGGFSDCDETSEEGVAREVKEETGLDVTHTEFLFSLPNTYLYSGFLVHTIDNFFRCTVAETRTAHAMDDAAELFWIPLAEVRPSEFGLESVKKGIGKLLDLQRRGKLASCE